MLGPYSENTIVVGDCLEVMGRMPDGCCDLIFADPPYNKGKADWDRGHDWQGWVAEVVRLLKFNGALWVIHRESRELAKISEYIEQLGGPPLANWITWDLFNGAQGNRGYLEGFTLASSLRSFQQMAEYLIYHTDDGQLRRRWNQQSGFIFEPVRAYLDGERQRAGLCIGDMNLICGTTFNQRNTNTCSVQWNMITEERYAKLQTACPKHFKRRYEDLRSEYENLRPTFNNPGLVSSVWQGPPAAKNGHETPKPEWLLERIIDTTSNEEDLIFDPFMGSGTTAVAADRLGRNFFGCDINPQYVEMALKRIEQDRESRSQLELF